jgi:hypothetical protein
MQIMKRIMNCLEYFITIVTKNCYDAVGFFNLSQFMRQSNLMQVTITTISEQ